MAEKGIELASAYISLSVSTDKVPRQVENALRGLKDENITVDVDAKTSGAATNVSRWRSSEERRPVNLKVRADTRAASSEVRGLRRDIENLRRSDVLRLNIGAAAISSLPMLAAGLGEVASALQQVSQAALAIPGGIAGAVASVGTLAFGLTGVSDAYDALNKAADDAATSGGDVADQARAQMSASNGLRNAIVDEEQARKDVTRATKDAQRALSDLRIEQRGGVIDEKRAVLEAQKAREALLTGDYSDYRDAVLRVEEADQRVVEVRERNKQTTEDLNEAHAKGVANSDQVVAANERLVRAQQGVAQSQAALAASAPKASAAQENAALAMSKLHPEMQRLVQTTFDFVNGPGMDLRNMLAGNIATGLSEQLTGLATKAMPTFEKGLGRISEVWNDTFTELIRVAGEDENIGLIDRIFGNTAEAQSLLTEVIDPLAEAMLTLTAAGSDSLPRLADGLTSVTERFAEFITNADADGRLQAWIDEGITGLGHLGETALNVGKMFTAVGDAADGNLLVWLRDVTGQWQQFLNSAQGQQTLRAVFEEGKEVLNQWRPILEDIPGLFKGIYEAVDTYMGLMLPILDRVTTILADHPRLVELAAGAYVAFKSAQVLGAISTLSTALTGLGNKLGKPGAGKGGRGGSGILGQLSLITGLGLTASALGDDGMPTIDSVAGPAIAGAAIAGGPGFVAGTVLGGATAVYDAFQTQAQHNADVQRSHQDWIDSLPPGVPFAPGQTAPPGSGSPGRNPLDVIADRATTTPSTRTAPTLDDFLGSTGGAGSMSPGGKPIPGTSKPATGSYGLPAGTNTGGYGTGTSDTFPPWVMQIADAFGIKPSTYAGHQESNRNEPGYAPNPQGLNRGIDWSGPVANMQRFADYLKTVPGALEQVIWQNPSTGAAVEIAGGQPSPGYFSGDLGGHQDHVHTRQSMPIPLPPWVKTFDRGGWLPPGVHPINNATGKPELILNPEQIEHLKRQGIDPNALLHGQTQGAPLGPAQAGVAVPYAEGAAPTPEQATALEPAAFRTEGFIPAGAGYSGKTGAGVVGGLIALGGEAAKGAIQVAADLGKMAASAAASAGTMGAGAAAGPAAGAGIQIGADMAKRGVDYGVEMANIGIGAVTEILSPFGAPRWLSDVDPTAFMPNLGGGALATTAAEAIAQGMGPGMADPNAVQHGQNAGAAPGPVPPGPQQGPPVPHQGAGAPPGPPGAGNSAGQSLKPPAPAPTAPKQQEGFNFLDIIKGGIFDSGGVLQPNTAAVNLSSRPEYVFTDSQWKTMEAHASRGSGTNVTYNVMGKDLDEALREMKKHERRTAGPLMRSKAGL